MPQPLADDRPAADLGVRGDAGFGADAHAVGKGGVAVHVGARRDALARAGPEVGELGHGAGRVVGGVGIGLGAGDARLVLERIGRGGGHLDPDLAHRNSASGE